MKKIKRLSLVLFIFSVLALSYPMTHVFAQGGAHVSGAHLSGSQPQGGHEPPRHPGTPNEPRGSILLVKKLEKMNHELKECQSLTKELKSASQPAARSSQPPAQCAPDPGKVSLCAPHRIFPAQEELGLRQLLFNLGIMQRPETGLNMDKLLHIARMHREYCQQGD